ncbi:GNAT family N-acetyltransferase [Bacillus cereus]|uniref:GNAT family N-acetyltransferase n=1 Tax=Bacillus cereus TaxID=1396 RepID=UPI0024071DFE|nr:GNAT family N-acetyltransferase [Bacillus cereus]MDF9505053.1 GNAT family N-acetyltransferase [Bacillus cereus]MDF9597195.1 GNAT family N-acetyltransferase [Bacillus cereus]MDF9609021.1 GNAT family N-acetyltransferase [Bacillus cereus]MDF9660235.1 GNAT family N-acetyltransferase [Bacillus cereus]
MLTTLPIIMTTNGQKLKCSFTSITERCDFDHISFDMQFHDLVNNSRVGTASCRIQKDQSENKIEITITSLDANHIGNGVGTAMVYSIYRWTYFSYPGYELRFNGMISTAFDEKYLIGFYTKVGFIVKNGFFNLKVERNEFHKFCTNTEGKITEMCFTFLSKQNESYNKKIDTYLNILSHIEKKYNSMSLISFIKQRYFRRKQAYNENTFM